MKNVSWLSYLAIAFALLVQSETSKATTIADFEDITLAPNSALAGEAGAAGKTPIVSNGVQFNRTYLDGVPCCPGAFAVSNQTDLTTPGFGNPYSAYHLPSGGGVDGSDNFAVAFNFGDGDSIITLPEATTVQGAYFTNNSYAFLSMRDGDGFAKQFGPDDWFLLEVIGKDDADAEIGRVDVYLADFRDGRSIMLDEWTWFDLSSLGSNVKTLEFAMSSSDTGGFGMNTPAYFALDNLTFGAATAPEPSTLILASFAGLALCFRVRRRIHRHEAN